MAAILLRALVSWESYGLLTVNAESAVATINGRLGLPPGVHEFRINDGGPLPDLRINAHILGGGHLRKTGAGQLWLAASNSYTGVTFVDAGTLSALNAYALGAATAGTTVNEGATLDLNAITTTMPESLALRGTGVNGNGALDVFGLATLRRPFPRFIQQSISRRTPPSTCVEEACSRWMDLSAAWGR